MNIKNQVLYNKWRPKQFKDVVGQNYIIEYIINSIIENKVHHTYLLVGNRGTGKTTIARLFVKSLNCINLDINNKNYLFPCNYCNNCNLIYEKKFVDLLEVDAATKNSVEDIKDLLSGINYLPIKSKYKIYIIDEIHMLSKQGFSSLLKSLEEPPEYIKFILITNEIKKIPDTILSRCIILNLYNISITNIVNRIKYILKNENIKYDLESLNLIAEFSKGSLRDAINIIEKCILINNKYIKIDSVIKILGVCEIRTILDIIKSVIFNDSDLLYYKLSYLNKSFINYENLVLLIINLLHSILMINLNNDYILDDIYVIYKKYLLKFSDKKYINKIRNLLNIIISYNNKFIYNYNNKIWFNILIIEIFNNI